MRLRLAWEHGGSRRGAIGMERSRRRQSAEEDLTARSTTGIAKNGGGDEPPLLHARDAAPPGSVTDVVVAADSYSASIVRA
jgi:hypothetical protein